MDYKNFNIFHSASASQLSIGARVMRSNVVIIHWSCFLSNRTVLFCTLLYRLLQKWWFVHRCTHCSKLYRKKSNLFYQQQLCAALLYVTFVYALMNTRLYPLYSNIKRNQSLRYVRYTEYVISRYHKIPLYVYVFHPFVPCLDKWFLLHLR